VPGVKALQGHQSFAYNMTASGPVSTMNKIGHQNIRMVDSSHKVSMSGKNLLNLTQSAETREEKQDAEKYSSQKVRT